MLKSAKAHSLFDHILKSVSFSTFPNAPNKNMWLLRSLCYFYKYLPMIAWTRTLNCVRTTSEFFRLWSEKKGIKRKNSIIIFIVMEEVIYVIKINIRMAGWLTECAHSFENHWVINMSYGDELSFAVGVFACMFLMGKTLALFDELFQFPHPPQWVFLYGDRVWGSSLRIYLWVSAFRKSGFLWRDSEEWKLNGVASQNLQLKTSTLHIVAAVSFVSRVIVFL